MKVVIVKNGKNSRWVSCNAISSNLQQLYADLEKEGKLELKWFEVGEVFSPNDLVVNNLVILDLVKVIESFKPEKLIFVDHLPGPYFIIYHLSLIMSRVNIPKIIIHIYGDFTYFAKRWYSLNDYAMGLDIRFIVASDAQKRLVKNFLEVEDVNQVEQLCFPVKSSEYYFCESRRTQCRQDLGLYANDFVIIYTGRISTQKNVDLLIKEFSKIDLSNEHINFHLWIVGEFDDYGAHLLGFESVTGIMFNMIQEILSQLPEPLREKITFWGHKDKEDMQILLNAADMFASFSLYHDEDFGMSPAEALSTGIPTCLSYWGGYYSFAPENHEWECALVPVDLTDFGYSVKVYKFHEYLKYLISNKAILEGNRQKRSSLFLKKFSIEGNISTLYSILNNSNETFFSGFNWLLNIYWKSFNYSEKNRKLNKDFIPQTKNYYYQIYKNYLKVK